MDTNSLFEYLIPALFFVFYILTKILEARTPKASPRDIPEESESATVDEVRREIQRKILERQKHGSSSVQRSIPEKAWSHETKPSPQPKHLPLIEPTPNQRDYALLLKKEKLRVEASRELAQKARNKHAATCPRRAFQKAHVSVHETLRDPIQSRRAYLYHEIFGAPLALRRNDGMFPSWKQ
jgi:hypothetical protein